MSTIVYYNKKLRKKMALKEALNNMTLEEIQELLMTMMTEKIKDI